MGINIRFLGTSTARNDLDRLAWNIFMLHFQRWIFLFWKSNTDIANPFKIQDLLFSPEFVRRRLFPLAGDQIVDKNDS